MWHKIKCAETKGKEKLRRHNNNKKKKKKDFKLLFIQIFKSITRGAVATELYKESNPKTKRDYVSFFPTYGQR